MKLSIPELLFASRPPELRTSNPRQRQLGIYGSTFWDKSVGPGHCAVLPNDVKIDNIFVNCREGDIRFSDVQLGDLGGTYPNYAKE
ncbi:MAG: hypothetical protein Q9217_006569, partial [Psora testacea]